MITHDYTVYDKQGFLHTLNKIVKRYKATVEVIWRDTFTQKFYVNHHNLNGFTNSVNITCHPVTVNFDFDEFKIEGYSYLGCIKDELMMGLITIHGNESLKGRDINDFVKSFDDIPCHNCNRRHKRKVGHLFLHEDTNEVLVFGSSCAKNFFGINFDRLLNFFERINIAFGDDWDGDYVSGYRSTLIDWRSVAKLAYYEITKSGYISGTKAKQQSRNSTGDYTRMMYLDDNMIMTPEVKQEINEMNFPDMDIISTKSYVNDMTNPNDFEHNLMVLQESMVRECVTYKNYGMIAFMVWNEFFKEAETPKEPKVEYIIPEWAEAGVRVKKNEMPLDCKVDAIKAGNGTYGPWWLYTFVNSDNVCLKWFASRDQELEVGQDATLNGFSVKKVEDNQYGKSVAITRVILEDGKPAPVRAPRPVKPSVEDKEYFDRLGIDTNDTWGA